MELDDFIKMRTAEPERRLPSVVASDYEVDPTALAEFLGVGAREDKEYTAWQPKHLSAKHKAMLEYHLQGFTNREISEHFGHHEVMIGWLVRSDLAQAYCKQRLDDLNLEFRGQFSGVVQTFRDALAPSTDIGIRLSAADKWLKAHGRYGSAGEATRLSAEDVVAKLLEKSGHVSININNGQQVINGGSQSEPEDEGFLIENEGD